MLEVTSNIVQQPTVIDAFLFVKTLEGIEEWATQEWIFCYQAKAGNNAHLSVNRHTIVLSRKVVLVRKSGRNGTRVIPQVHR